MAALVLTLMSILGIGFLGTRIASVLKIPHSVFLVVLGVAAGMLIRGHWSDAGSTIPYLTQLFPDLVLYVLLPPLIFESAYNLDFELLRQELFPLAMLSVVALVLSTGLVGFALHGLFGLELIPSLVFGALISATDPVAVVALFKEVGAPPRLTTLIEGESILNDGTAIVLFRVLLAAAAASHLGGSLLLHGGLQFLAVTLGGAATGVAAGWITRVLLKLTSSSGTSQLGITVVSAYFSFIFADHYLGASGAISTLVVGLYLGRRARIELNRDAIEGMKHIWEFLSLSANTLVFLAVGVAVDPSLLLHHFAVIPLTLAVVYLARAISVFATIPAANALGLSKPISLAYQSVLFWGGLRGGLALGLVLLLPDWFPHKQLFIALAIAVVSSTLLINALTTKKALRLLKLDRLDQAEESFYEKTLEMAQKSAFEPLLLAAERGHLSATLVAEQLEAATCNLNQVSTPRLERRSDDQGFKFGVSSLLLNERRSYNLRLQDGVLSREAYLKLERLVSSRFDIFNQGGIEALAHFVFDLGVAPENRLVAALLKRVGRNDTQRMLSRLTTQLEVLLHLQIGLEESLKSSYPAPVAKLAEDWFVTVNQELRNFYAAYPHYGSAVQSLFIANTIQARSKKVVQQLSEAVIVNGAVRAKAELRIRKAHLLSVSEAKKLLRPTRSYLVGRVPLFKDLPKTAIKKIAEFSKVSVLEPGETAFSAGDEGHSFYLVAAGMLEVRYPGAALDAALPKLFTGDFFGELSLLFGRPRIATVTALMTTELLELDQKTFEFILSEYPIVKTKIYEAAKSRMDNGAEPRLS